MEETATGIKRKFQPLTFNPLPTTELDKRTHILADELEKLKKDYYNLRGVIWVLKQQQKTQK